MDVSHDEKRRSKVMYIELPKCDETTKQSPFFTEKGYEPRTSFDWESPVKSATPKGKLNRKEAKAFVTRLHESWQQAKDKRYGVQANKYRRLVDFGVGDEVWVTTKYWKNDRLSRKLVNLEQVRHSFSFKLPESVFHAEKLRKDPGNPQFNPKPPTW